MSQSASDGLEQDEELIGVPLEVLYLGDEDVLPSGREHTEKFSINTDTIDGVHSRLGEDGTQYTVSAYSPVHDYKIVLPEERKQIEEYT